MKLFKQREPRRFNHKYIYVDERKEKLDRIVENAKRDLGMLPPTEVTYRERLKGRSLPTTLILPAGKRTVSE